MSYNKNYKGKKPNNQQREFIDFKKLDGSSLRKLSDEWEQAARIFEFKLQSYMNSPNPNQEKLERLWKVGDSLWRRLNILERFRVNNPIVKKV